MAYDENTFSPVNDDDYSIGDSFWGTGLYDPSLGYGDTITLDPFVVDGGPSVGSGEDFISDDVWPTDGLSGGFWDSTGFDWDAFIDQLVEVGAPVPYPTTPVSPTGTTPPRTTPPTTPPRTTPPTGGSSGGSTSGTSSATSAISKAIADLAKLVGDVTRAFNPRPPGATPTAPAATAPGADLALVVALGVGFAAAWFVSRK